MNEHDELRRRIEGPEAGLALTGMSLLTSQPPSDTFYTKRRKDPI